MKGMALFSGTAFFGFVFILIGLGSLVIGQFLATGAFIGCGIALILPGRDPKAWSTLPSWRRAATMIALVVGAAFFAGLLLTSL